jgi:hypothetical protein
VAKAKSKRRARRSEQGQKQPPPYWEIVSQLYNLLLGASAAKAWGLKTVMTAEPAAGVRCVVWTQEDPTTFKTAEAFMLPARSPEEALDSLLKEAEKRKAVLLTFLTHPIRKRQEPAAVNPKTKEKLFILDAFREGRLPVAVAQTQRLPA